MIPKKLYRGDADKKNNRILKKNLRNRLLFTNLISGGIGKDAFNKPLIELVKDHISPGWDKSHFLSFSELEERAVFYGSNGFESEIIPYDEEEDDWNYALLIFDTTQIRILKVKEKGVYQCSYKASLIEFNGIFSFILIDTEEYLKSNNILNTNIQLENVERDKEWLMLPTNFIYLNNNAVEYSAKIDMG